MNESTAGTLDEQALAFAGKVNYALQSALGRREHLIQVLQDRRRLMVTTVQQNGLPLTVQGRPAFRLKYRALCHWDDRGHFLAVQYSYCMVYSERVAEPILRLDYRKDASSEPVSHYQVHSYHPGLRKALKDSAAGTRASKHQQPQEIRLPTGGRRFRPMLEDLLETLIRDLGVDAARGWEDEFAEARAIYKQDQLAASIRDTPQYARDVLRELGYNVSWDCSASEPELALTKLAQL